MTLGLLFWLLFILYFLFGGYLGFRTPVQERPYYFGGYGFQMILIFILGWKVFGFVIQG